MGQRTGTTTETKLFTAITLIVGAVVVAAVAYDIYLHPPDPKPVATATIKVSGTSHIEGDVGTVSTTNAHGTFAIEGRAPVTVEVPFGRADHVVADIERESGMVEIRVACKPVAKQEASGAVLMWKVPRGWDPYELPKGWPKCPKKRYVL